MTHVAEIPEGLYPMRVVTRMTGLTADTIRAWERRYRAIEPPRSDGNTRRFTAADVRRLIKLREATSRGHTIRAIAGLTEEQLATLVEQDQELPMARAEEGAEQTDRLFERIRAEYLDAIRRFDVTVSESLLSRAATFFRARDVIYQILLPIVRDTGTLWQHREFSVAQEHLVSMQLRTLLSRLRALHSPPPGAAKIVITTPEGHYHEFGVLVGALLAANRGLETVYLGPSLPLADIRLAVERSRAELVLLGVARDLTMPESEALRKTLRTLVKQVEVWVGIAQTHTAWGDVSGVRYFDRFEDLEIALAERTA